MKDRQGFLGVLESNWRKGAYYANSGTGLESTHKDSLLAGLSGTAAQGGTGTCS